MFVSVSWHPSFSVGDASVVFHSWQWKQNGGQCDRAYGEVKGLGGPFMPYNCLNVN